MDDFAETITLTADDYERLFRRKGRPAVRDVYFVRAVKLGLVKIGTADNAAVRLRQLALSSPDKLRLLGLIKCDRSGALEREVHQEFGRLRLHGEWFKGTRALLGYIAENAYVPDDELAALQAVLDAPNKPKGRRSRAAGIEVMEVAE
jgi:hypothetical protein